ncbi:RNA polymerase II mediator complex subunit, partial [Tulasnella sp. 417]
AKSRDVLDKGIRKQIKAALPVIFGGDASTESATNFSFLLSASCFDQQFAVAHWLYPAALNQMASDGSSSMDNKTYATLVEIMRLCRCYSSILDLSLRLLQKPDENDVQAIVDTFIRHADVWASMDALSTIGETLFATHSLLKSSQRDSRVILEALSRPEYSKHLSPETKQQIEIDSIAISQGIQMSGPALGTLHPIIQEIRDLKDSVSLDEASALAHRLWEQFKHNSGVGQVIWDNVIQGVAQVEALSPDDSLRMEYVRLYSHFLQTFSRLLPLDNTLDSAVNLWFRHEDGRREFSDFDANTWMTISLFILEMVLQGCLTTSTVLSNVPYVAWKKAADLEAPSEQAETFLRAATLLTERLLLQDVPSQQAGIPNDLIPPLDLIQVQRYQTQRQKIYTGSGVKSLFGAMRNLVWLELNAHLSQDVRDESTRIRMALCQHHQFRTTAFRHLVDLKQLFVRSLSSEKDVRLADALRLIVHVDDGPEGHSGAPSEPSSEWRAVFAQLNAWGFSRASIELRLTLESMGSGLALTSGPTKAKAEHEIKGFMAGLFCRDLHPEETDLTAQVLDGLSGPVATQFINYGVNRLAELLENLEAQPLSENSVSHFLE